MANLNEMALCLYAAQLRSPWKIFNLAISSSRAALSGNASLIVTYSVAIKILLHSCESRVKNMDLTWDRRMRKCWTNRVVDVDINVAAGETVNHRVHITRPRCVQKHSFVVRLAVIYTHTFITARRQPDAIAARWSHRLPALRQR